MTGKIICIGLGPGDPELMSVRADRAIRAARQPPPSALGAERS